MDAICSYSPSYSSISVWNDPWIPAQRPRSAIQKLQNQYLNPLLKVEDLINPVDLSWNLDLLNAYVHKDDVSIIRSLAISRNPKPDSDGWLTPFLRDGYRLKNLLSLVLVLC